MSGFAKNRHDKKKEIYEDLGLMAMGVSNKTIPSITDNVMVLMTLKQGTDKDDKTRTL